MKALKKAIGIFAASALLLAALPAAVSAEGGKSDDIVILYTNDVHCGIDTFIGYDGLALYKREMQEQYDNVLLIDAGDAIQGAPVGSVSEGAYITRLMNAVGYDAAIPGNHEFDYGMEEFMQCAEDLGCGYICANFCDASGELVFSPYKIVGAGDKKIGFVGVTTPETFSKSTPVFFQNDKGEYIYSFGEDGTLCERVQNAADAAKAEGADYVILIAHLGESYVTEGWSSPELVAELTGIDAVIDGHSHEVTPALSAKTKDGREIVITQTGTKLANIGKMTIASDGTITTELVDTVPAPAEDSGIAEDSWLEPDDRPGRFVDEAINREMMLIKEEYAEILGRVIGHTDFDLLDTDAETGERRVRRGGTNLGDFCADAFRYVLGTDAAIINGGGIRATINAGDITYYDAMNVFPFGNMACTAEVTGQQILDVLESGAMKYPGESGIFAHVSGIEYTIDPDVTSSVKLSDKGGFIGVEGEYRVKNVMIGGEPLEKDKIYLIASHNYLLKNGGDGFIFSGRCNIIKDEVMEECEVLAAYIRDNLGGVIPEQYADAYGDGRIKTAVQTAGQPAGSLSAEITADRDHCYVGDEFIVTLSVKNTGDTELTGVTLYFEDIELTTFETLAAGASEELSFKLKAWESDIESGGIINVSATANEVPDPARSSCTVKVLPAEQNPATGTDDTAVLLMLVSLGTAALTLKRRK